MSESLELLRVLADGKPHSLEGLARAFSVCPDTIALWLGNLEELGVAFVNGPEGWEWSDPVELLHSEQILDGMGPQARRLMSHLEVLGEVDSTNRFLMDAARNGAENGYVCLAECQTKGKGRRGRGFVSPIGNIYQSVLWYFEEKTNFLSGLSVAMGVVVSEALRRLGITEVGVKWPNDIYWRSQKLSGILVETSLDSKSGIAVVVGVGVNFRMARKPAKQIEQPWVDVHSAAASVSGRNRAVAYLLEAILLGLDQFSREGFLPFQHRWNRLDVMRDQFVRLHREHDDVAGKAVGVDDTGALLLDVNGIVRPFVTGDVSLRLLK